MRKQVFGRKLSRDTKGRLALFKNLATALVTYGKIQTTEAKAKAVRSLIDRLVHFAKDGSVAKRRMLARFLPRKIVKKLVTEVAPGFATRTSGFTRILKMGPRLSDNAPMVLMEWVENIEDRKLKIEDRKDVKEKKKKPATTENTEKISDKTVLAGKRS